MRCPKCHQISFDYLSACPKCGEDLSAIGSKLFQLRDEPKYSFWTWLQVPVYGVDGSEDAIPRAKMSAKSKVADEMTDGEEELVIVMDDDFTNPDEAIKDIEVEEVSFEDDLVEEIPFDIHGGIGEVIEKDDRSVTEASLDRPDDVTIEFEPEKTVAEKVKHKANKALDDEDVEELLSDLSEDEEGEALDYILKDLGVNNKKSARPGDSPATAAQEISDEISKIEDIIEGIDDLDIELEDLDIFEKDGKEKDQN